MRSLVLRTLPSSTYRTPSSRPTCLTSTARFLYVKLELRAITNNHRSRQRALVMSSTIPSAKYSCSRSPLMFWNGKIAIEGLSGICNAEGKVLPVLLSARGEAADIALQLSRRNEIPFARKYGSIAADFHHLQA